MTWILRLYPRRWRRRYGGEVAAMLEGRGFSLAIAIDLIAGAIDARLHPAATLPAVAAESHDKEGTTMLQRLARMECAATAGTQISKTDYWKAAGVSIGGTLVMSLFWMTAHARTGDNPYVDSLSILSFMLPVLLSMRYTYLKRRSVAAQAIFITGMSLMLVGIMLGAAWIAAQI